MIVMMAGLPGTGKSTLARELALRLSGAVLDKDVIRAALFAEDFVEYSAPQDDFCQEEMLYAAAYLLARRPSLHVFLDGRTFSQSYQRERVIAFCARIGARWAMIECVCDPATALGRIEQAIAKGDHPAKNRTPDLYRRVRATWQPASIERLVVNTDELLAVCVEGALSYIAKLAAA